MVKSLGIILLVLSLLMPTAIYALSGDGDIPEARPTMYTSSGITFSEETGEARDLSGDFGSDLMLLLGLVMETLAALP